MQISNAGAWDYRAKGFSRSRPAEQLTAGYRPASLSFSGALSGKPLSRPVQDSVKFRGNRFSAPASIPVEEEARTTRPAKENRVSQKFSFALNAPVHTPEVSAYLKTFPQFGPPPFNAQFHAERRDKLMSMLPKNTTLI